ncbi:hypothetical protein JCM8547_001467 [Rhodosporidiobolus lusitaniae]
MPTHSPSPASSTPAPPSPTSTTFSYSSTTAPTEPLLPSPASASDPDTGDGLHSLPSSSSCASSGSGDESSSSTSEWSPSGSESEGEGEGDEEEEEEGFDMLSSREFAPPSEASTRSTDGDNGEGEERMKLSFPDPLSSPPPVLSSPENASPALKPEPMAESVASLLSDGAGDGGTGEYSMLLDAREEVEVKEEDVRQKASLSGRGWRRSTIIRLVQDGDGGEGAEEETTSTPPPVSIHEPAEKDKEQQEEKSVSSRRSVSFSDVGEWVRSTSSSSTSSILLAASTTSSGGTASSGSSQATVVPPLSSSVTRSTILKPVEVDGVPVEGEKKKDEGRNLTSVTLPSSPPLPHPAPSSPSSSSLSTLVLRHRKTSALVALAFALAISAVGKSPLGVFQQRGEASVSRPAVVVEPVQVEVTQPVQELVEPVVERFVVGVEPVEVEVVGREITAAPVEEQPVAVEDLALPSSSVPSFASAPSPLDTPVELVPLPLAKPEGKAKLRLPASPLLPRLDGKSCACGGKREKNRERREDRPALFHDDEEKEQRAPKENSEGEKDEDDKKPYRPAVFASLPNPLSTPPSPFLPLQHLLPSPLFSSLSSLSHLAHSSSRRLARRAQTLSARLAELPSSSFPEQQRRRLVKPALKAAEKLRKAVREEASRSRSLPSSSSALLAEAQTSLSALLHHLNSLNSLSTTTPAPVLHSVQNSGKKWGKKAEKHLKRAARTVRVWRKVFGRGKGGRREKAEGKAQRRVARKVRREEEQRKGRE